MQAEEHLLAPSEDSGEWTEEKDLSVGSFQVEDKMLAPELASSDLSLEVGEPLPFLARFDLQHLGALLSLHKLGPSELRYLKVQSPDFDGLCAELRLSVAEKLRFKHAVEQMQREEKERQERHEAIRRLFVEQRQRYVVPPGERPRGRERQTAAVKFMLVGDSSVGKTCLMERVVHDVFSAQNVSTVGIDFQAMYLDIGTEVLKFELWDTGGQERFRAMPKSYARRMDGLFLCYDVTCADSFRSVREWHAELDEAMDLGDRVMILVGCKCDEEELRVVSAEEALEYANTIQAQFMECSAKSCQNLMALMLAAANKGLERREGLQDVPLRPEGQEARSTGVVRLTGAANNGRESQSQFDEGCPC